MPRIYSNYTISDFNMLKEMADELGFSLSAFQHYCVMLYADKRDNQIPMAQLISAMLANLKKLNVGDTFIVSSLLPTEWASLNRSEKTTLAKQLQRHVEMNSDYDVYKVVKGEAKRYIRVK